MVFDVLSIIKEYSYIGIFIIVFLECGIFFLLPGDSLLFAVGLLASRGFISFFPAVILIVIAGILGGEAGYFIGKYFEKWFDHSSVRRFFPKDKIELAKEFFYKNGNKTILICRFVPIVRTFAPIVVGFSEVKHSTFWKYNVLGGLLWGLTIPTIGYVFGNSVPGLEHNIGKISLIIIVISIVPLFIKFFKELQKKEREKGL
jgi:membrane-associated protein